MEHFRDIRTLESAKAALRMVHVDWTVAKRMVFRANGMRATSSARGIHVYFFNSRGQEVAYWTPIMETLTVHDLPVVWGNHIETDEYCYNV